EREIEELEKRKGQLESLLSQPAIDLEQINKWSSEIGSLVESIDMKTERWMELADKFQ
ncbi:MAG: hypothetical protein KDC80_00980, partial [Saprospiraceae bacterium]|nr:hypothetical protein [Saprospiraceae bacterium]